MNNQAITGLDLSSFGTMTSDQLQLIASTALQANVSLLQQQVETLRDDVIKVRTESSLAIGDIKQEVVEVREMQAKAIDVAVNSMRVKAPTKGWITLSQFGRCFAAVLSSQRMGKLMRVIGLAMVSTNRTTPYKQYIDRNKYVINEPDESGPRWKWNYAKCLHKIDFWLQEQGLFEKFYSISNEKEMENFIDALHVKHVESKRS